jgi:hypothetical protein
MARKKKDEEKKKKATGKKSTAKKTGTKKTSAKDTKKKSTKKTTTKKTTSKKDVKKTTNKKSSKKTESRKESKKAKRTTTSISLDDEESVEAVVDNFDSSGGSPDILKITKKHAVMITSKKIDKKYFHFLNGKSYECVDQINGFAPDDCKACKKSLEAFQKNNSENNGKDGPLKTLGKDLGSSFYGYVKVVEGDLISLGKKGGKKRMGIDFDEDEGVKEKIIRTTEATYAALFKTLPAKGNRPEIVCLKEKNSDKIKKLSDILKYGLLLKKGEGKMGMVTVKLLEKQDLPEIDETVDIEDHLPIVDVKEMNKALKAEIEKFNKKSDEDEDELDDVEREEVEDEDFDDDDENEVDDDDSDDDDFEDDDEDDDDDSEDEDEDDLEEDDDDDEFDEF